MTNFAGRAPLKNYNDLYSEILNAIINNLEKHADLDPPMSLSITTEVFDFNLMPPGVKKMAIKQARNTDRVYTCQYCMYCPNSNFKLCDDNEFVISLHHMYLPYDGLGPGFGGAASTTSDMSVMMAKSTEIMSGTICDPSFLPETIAEKLYDHESKQQKLSAYVEENKGAASEELIATIHRFPQPSRDRFYG